MKTFGNIVKLIATIIIISLMVLGIIMIINNISNLSDAFNNGTQKVFNTTTGGTIKQVRQVVIDIESITF